MFTDFVPVVRKLLKMVTQVVRFARVRRLIEKVDLKPVFDPEGTIDRTCDLLISHLTGDHSGIVEKKLSAIIIVDTFIESEIDHRIVFIPRKAESSADFAVIADEKFIKFKIVRKRMRSGKYPRNVRYVLGIVFSRVEFFLMSNEVLYMSFFTFYLLHCFFIVIYHYHSNTCFRFLVFLL